MTATIEINGLRKRSGPVQALDEMTFTVHPGHVTGFAGPNGAGKSTTMRVVLGLDAPDAGTATTAGHPYRSLQNPLTPTSGRCWTRARCSPAAAAATTCCGSPTPSAWRPAGSMR